MNPTLSSKGGIFLAGAIQGPKDISESVAQAGNAAAIAAAPLVKGYIEKEMLIPFVDYDLCVRCGLCKTVCAPAAIEIKDDGTPKINEVACKSCGMCMPACPTGAIQLLNFSDEQLLTAVALEPTSRPAITQINKTRSIQVLLTSYGLENSIRLPSNSV